MLSIESDSESASFSSSVPRRPSVNPPPRPPVLCPLPLPLSVLLLLALIPLCVVRFSFSASRTRRVRAEEEEKNFGGSVALEDEWGRPFGTLLSDDWAWWLSSLSKNAWCSHSAADDMGLRDSGRPRPLLPEGRSIDVAVFNGLEWSTGGGGGERSRWLL